jgi:hypothetical protein
MSLFELGKRYQEKQAIEEASAAMSHALGIARAKVAVAATPERRTVVKILEQMTGSKDDGWELRLRNALADILLNDAAKREGA